MSIENEIHVKIAEVKVGKNNDILKATLGSCVGIAFVCKERGLFGLAHCLLPEASDSSPVISAKYVSQAVPSLMALLKIKEENISDFQVFFAGGANMMPQLAKSNPDHVGSQNVAAAKKYLKKFGFNFKELETGGDVGRQIRVNCQTGEVTVHQFIKSGKGDKYDECG